MSVPIAQIPGTNLWSGIWYLVDLKADGRLTWANAKANTGYHVQIASGPEFVKYKEGGAFWKDGHWMIVPADKDEPGYYLLKNKTKSGSVMAWEGQSTTEPRAKWAVLINNTSDYQSGGRSRKDALWRLDPQEGSYYQLRNAKFLDNGVLTWSGYKTGYDKTNWCQVYTSGSEGNNKSDMDYLWSFTLVDPLPAECLTPKLEIIYRSIC